MRRVIFQRRSIIFISSRNWPLSDETTYMHQMGSQTKNRLFWLGSTNSEVLKVAAFRGKQVNQTNSNPFQVGPRRDVVGEFEKAVRKSPKLHFGLYHSLFEWFNPLFLEDAKGNFSTRFYAKNKVTPKLQSECQVYIISQCNNFLTYGKKNGNKPVNISMVREGTTVPSWMRGLGFSPGCKHFFL